MSKNFFVPKKIYEKRIAVCKSCDHYFKPTGSCKMCGCFMKIKARISQMDCPKLYWKSNSFDFDSTKKIPEVPDEIIKEVMELWPYIKTGKAKTQEKKKIMIELYNTIYGGHFKASTSCGSCLNNAFKGIEKIYNENPNYDKKI